MPALFSFLGGIANGYNESKAAEAKALQEKRLEDKKQKGRMEIAKYEATQAQRRDVLKTMADGWIAILNDDYASKEEKEEAMVYLRSISAAIGEDIFSSQDSSVESSDNNRGGSPVNPEYIPPPDATRSDRTQVD
jgi:hypothetical protein